MHLGSLGDCWPWCLLARAQRGVLPGCSAIAGVVLCLPGALFTQGGNDLLSHLRWSWVIILSVRMQVEIHKHRMAINQVMMALACPHCQPSCHVVCHAFRIESKSLEMKKCFTDRLTAGSLAREGRKQHDPC